LFRSVLTNGKKFVEEIVRRAEVVTLEILAAFIYNRLAFVERNARISGGGFNQLLAVQGGNFFEKEGRNRVREVLENVHRCVCLFV